MKPVACAGSGCVIKARPFAQGFAAARANLVPGFVLWVVGLVVVINYYFWPPSKGAFAAVANLKTEYGYLFAAISTGFFGGVLPFIFQKLQAGGARATPWNQLPFMTVYWSARGVEIDALYRLQAFVFGDEATAGVVTLKVLADQFLYCPFWCIPTVVLIYLWKDSGYDWKRTRERLGPHWYYRRAVPIMVSNWSVWIPAVAFIYLLPQPLQLPLQNIVVCFWVLLLMVLTAGDREEVVPAVEVASDLPD